MRMRSGAACQLGLGFIAASKCVARLYAGHGQKEGDASDKGYGGEDVNIQKGKGHAYSQCINAGGNGRSTMFLTSRSGFGHSSSLLKDSFIMFAPITASRMKATQWS